MMDLLINLSSGSNRAEPSPWANVYTDTTTPVVIPNPSGADSGWTIGYDPTRLPSGSDRGQFPTSGDASWVTNNVSEWSQQATASTGLYYTLLLNGPPNTTFTLEAFSSSDLGVSIDWRVNGGAPVRISELNNTSTVARFIDVTTDANGDASVGFATVSGFCRANAIRIILSDSPSVTLNNTTLTPGGTISGTCTDYSAAPTSPITVSDGTNTDNVTVSITDVGGGEYTFTGTMPAQPTVAEGSVTVTVGEASATATYSDGVTAGISDLTVQQEGSPVAATDWEVVVNLLSDGTELYNETSQVSDSAGLIGDVSLPERAVGETVEVLGYSAANSLWFWFYTDLVDLEA